MGGTNCEKMGFEWEAAERYTATAEARIAVMFLFDVILFGCTCLLTFLDLGLPIGGSIPKWWYVVLAHILGILASIVTIVIFIRDRGPPPDWMLRDGKMKKGVAVIDRKYAWKVLFAIHIAVLFADGFVYGYRFYQCVRCTVGESPAACVFVNSGSFWDWWGCIMGVALIFIDAASAGYVKSYRNSVRLEYRVKCELLQTARDDKVMESSENFTELHEILPSADGGLRRRMNF